MQSHRSGGSPFNCIPIERGYQSRLLMHSINFRWDRVPSFRGFLNLEMRPLILTTALKGRKIELRGRGRSWLRYAHRVMSAHARHALRGALIWRSTWRQGEDSNNDVHGGYSVCLCLWHWPEAVKS